MSAQELEAVTRAWYRAVETKDTDAVIDALAEDGSWYDYVPYRYDGKESYARLCRSSMKPFVNAEGDLHQLKVRMLGENAGVVYANDHFSADRADGSPGFKLAGRVTFVWEKIEGEWKMVHGHLSPLPQMSPAGSTVPGS